LFERRLRFFPPLDFTGPITVGSRGCRDFGDAGSASTGRGVAFPWNIPQGGYNRLFARCAENASDKLPVISAFFYLR
jgi:hypothetical protein